LHVLEPDLLQQEFLMPLPPTAATRSSPPPAAPSEQAPLLSRLIFQLQRVTNFAISPAAAQSRSTFYTGGTGSKDAYAAKNQHALKLIYEKTYKDIYFYNNLSLKIIFDALSRNGRLPLTGQILQQDLQTMCAEKKPKSAEAREEWAGMLRRIPTLLQGLNQGCAQQTPAYAERAKQFMTQHNACFVQGNLKKTMEQIEDNIEYANQVAAGLNSLYLEIQQTLPPMLVVDGKVQNQPALWHALLAAEAECLPTAEQTGDSPPSQVNDPGDEVHLRANLVQPDSTRRRAWPESTFPWQPPGQQPQ
jgi:hypothetical protein